MAWPLIMAAVGAGLEVMKRNEAKKQEVADRILAANTQAYSPWTGLKAGSITQAPSLAGSLGQGALSGYSMGDNLNSAAGADELRKAQIAELQAKTNKLNSGK